MQSSLFSVGGALALQILFTHAQKHKQLSEAAVRSSAVLVPGLCSLLSMLWFGFGFRGFGQLGEGEGQTLPGPEPVHIRGSDPERGKILRAAPSWSYSALVTGATPSGHM